MEEKDRMIHQKKKLMALFLLFTGIAVVCIGLVFVARFSGGREEAVNLSGSAADSQIVEGQAVTLDVDTVPILMMPAAEKGKRLYYAIAADSHLYIVSMSDEIFQHIVEDFNAETGRLYSAYRLKGIIRMIDDPVKELALSNGNRVFNPGELTVDNFSEKVGIFYVEENEVSNRAVTLYTISALVGVFFLILAFGYVVPAMVRAGKGDFGISDEKNMRQTLEKYLPYGESLTAGVYGTGLKTEIREVFGGCRIAGDQLVPDETGAVLEVSKSKYSKYDIYVGITGKYLLYSACQDEKHLYEYNNSPEPAGTAVRNIDACIPLKAVGTCFPISEIQKCTIKNERTGAVICSVTMKNGSLLEFMLPKSGGPGMPHYMEHRAAIIAGLSAGRE